METIVETEGLCKEYGGVYRVKDLDVRIREGEVYGFLGPNGAGKSTTMKLLLGLAKPTSGTVRLFGKKLGADTRADILKQVGSLIESPSYYGHLTGRENLQVMQRLMDLPRENVKLAVQIVRLENQLEKKVKNYSLGMKQRLGIAMALARFPRLLILDEPTNGLDPAGIEEIRELITEMPGRYGITVMISSHLLGEIDQMATAVGIIKGGELIFQDSMEQLNLRRRPYLLLRTGDDRAAAQVLQPLCPKWLPHRVALENPADGLAARAVEALVQSGIPIYRVEERQRSLEDVFLELTGKELSL